MRFCLGVRQLLRITSKTARGTVPSAEELSSEYRLAMVCRASASEVTLFHAGSNAGTVYRTTEFRARYAGTIILLAPQAKRAQDPDSSATRKLSFCFRWFLPELGPWGGSVRALVEVAAALFRTAPDRCECRPPARGGKHPGVHIQCGMHVTARRREQVDERMNSPRVASVSAAYASIAMAFLCPVSALCADVRPPPDVSCGIHSPGQTYSAQEIDAMLDRPTDFKHLLRNLKLAMDKDLLLQPGFYTDANLLKFFNGTRVTWSTPSPHMKNMTWRRFEVVADRRVLPGTTVDLLRSCDLRPAFTGASGLVPAHIATIAVVDIPVGDVPGFTVDVVRSVFGDNGSSFVDSGAGTDGGRYVPTSKGSLTYDDGVKERSAKSNVERSSVKFFVKLDSPTALAGGARSWEIDHDNQIKSIHMWSRER